jgi:hypothetical protein
MPEPERDRYYNLILLCPTHHTIVDKSETDFTIDALLQMKSSHETWVATQLGVAGPTANEIRYAELIQGWQERTIDSEWWRRLLSDCFVGRNTVRRSDLKAAKESYEWIFARRLPGGLTAFEAEYKRFEIVLGTLITVLDLTLETIDRGDPELLAHPPDYKLVPFASRREAEVEWDWVGNVIPDLAFEITRCANAVCEAVVTDFEPLFRSAEGVVLLVVGADLYRPEYRCTDQRFEDLSSFLDQRESRDHNIGRGRHESGERKIGVRPESRADHYAP